MAEQGTVVRSIEKRNCPSCGQENEAEREVCWACYAKLAEKGAKEGVASEPQQGSPLVSGLRAESPSTEDVCMDWGAAVELAYRPSGKPGQTSILLVHGAKGFFVGLAKAAALLAAAAAVNLIHNLLPVFFFVLPLIIVGIMLAAPFMVGTTVGDYVAKGVAAAKCRLPAQAGWIVLMWTVGGLIFFLIIAQRATAPGESFLFDRLIWFVRLMVSGSITFNWLEAPEPLSPAYEGAILGLLGVSTLLGAAMAYNTAAAMVRSTLFCEHCKKYLNPETLWSISPPQGQRAIRAFQSLDYNDIDRIPHCRQFDNFISVELWSCSCDSRAVLELVGHGVVPAADENDKPKTQDPVRIFSRTLSREQVERIRE